MDPVIKELTNYVIWTSISMGIVMLIVFLIFVFFLWKKIGEEKK